MDPEQAPPPLRHEFLTSKASLASFIKPDLEWRDLVFLLDMKVRPAIRRALLFPWEYIPINEV